MATSVINKWLNLQSPEGKKAFHDYCRKHYHCKPNVLQYLIDNGCPINSISSVYKWMSENVQPGERAVLFNAENEAFVGVDLLPLLEKMAVQASRIANIYIRKIEEGADDVSIGDAVSAFPSALRELRGIIDLYGKLKIVSDERSLLLSGAARVLQIVSNSPNVKDQAEEEFFRKELEAALLQIKREMED
jgi:hypothetical protein